MESLRLKLDENLPRRALAVARERGHDVETAESEGLLGAADQQIERVCVAEDRILITLDLDFADVRVYQPGQLPGTMVLRPATQGTSQIVHLLQAALALAEREPPRGQLWLVEPGKVRVRG